MDEQNCQLCATHEIFKGLVGIGYDTEEAFHLSVERLLTNVIEKTVETTYDTAHQDGIKEGHEKGYDEGYNQATVDVAEVVVAYAKSANDL